LLNVQELIELSPVDKVIVTDSLPLAENASPKILQVSVAELIGTIFSIPAK